MKWVNSFLCREDRWLLFVHVHLINNWTIPWDSMSLPTHEWFNKYTVVYGTDIEITIPKTIEECNDWQEKLLKEFGNYYAGSPKMLHEEGKLIDTINQETVKSPTFTTPKTVGGYRLGNSTSYYTQFNLTYKPNWLHRQCMRIFLGWYWFDEK